MRAFVFIIAIFVAATTGAFFGNLSATHFVVRQWEQAEKRRRAEKSERLRKVYERMVA